MNRTVLVQHSLEGDANMDRVQLLRLIEAEIQNQNNQGYKVVSVMPLTNSNNDYQDDENQSYGYGYSFTGGAIIVFEEAVE